VTKFSPHTSLRPVEVLAGDRSIVFGKRFEPHETILEGILFIYFGYQGVERRYEGRRSKICLPFGLCNYFLNSVNIVSSSSFEETSELLLREFCLVCLFEQNFDFWDDFSFLLGSNFFADVERPNFLSWACILNVWDFWRVCWCIVFIVVPDLKDFLFSIYLENFEGVFFPICRVVVKALFEFSYFVKIPFNQWSHCSQVLFNLLLLEFLLFFDPMLKLDVWLFVECRVLSRFNLLLNSIDFWRRQSCGIWLAVNFEELLWN